MFNSEIEDMIPRCAPKPSVSDAATPVISHSVPEISIVFSPRESRQSISTPPSAITSYAVWKSKCLPSDAAHPTTFKLKSNYTEVPTISTVYPFEPMVPNVNTPSVYISSNKTDSLQTTRKNTETQCGMEPQTVQCRPICVPTSSHFNQKQCNLFAPEVVENNILTICAGTQTENSLSNGILDTRVSDLATKEDIGELKSIIVAMQTEQRYLMELIHHLVEKNTTNQPKLKDVETQCDGQLSAGNVINKRPQMINYLIEEEDLTEEKEYVYQPLNLPTPKVQAHRLCVLPKPATEKSMVMNELALKYLPNGNLNDFLQDVPTETQSKNQYELTLENKENLDKNPTDLSTASYRYLRKYRLFPEENQKLHSTKKQEQLVDLETIRCKPKFM